MPKNLMLNFKDLKQKSVDYKSIFHENHTRILIIALYLIGIWAGTMLYKNNYDISSLTLKGINYIFNSDLLKIFALLMLIKTGSALLVFLCGFSACGMPLIIGLPCIYGIICGLINSCIYQTYKLNGVFFSLIIIVPFAVITSLAITALADNSLNLSKQIVKILALGEAGKRGDVKKYIIYGVIITAGLCITQFIQAILILKPGEMILNF